MPEPLLKLLELCLLALLWLFFLRVLRAVWSEVRGPAATAAVARPTPTTSGRRAPGRKRGTPRLVVVDPKDRKGRAYELKDEQTVGRAAGCQITLDDTYVSQLHARIFAKDGTWFVEDLGSTNGTYLNTKRVSTPLAVKRGDQIKIGAVIMEAEV
jgi:hypothetical protein